MKSLLIPLCQRGKVQGSKRGRKLLKCATRKNSALLYPLFGKEGIGEILDNTNGIHSAPQERRQSLAHRADQRTGGGARRHKYGCRARRVLGFRRTVGLWQIHSPPDHCGIGRAGKRHDRRQQVCRRSETNRDGVSGIRSVSLAYSSRKYRLWSGSEKRATSPARSQCSETDRVSSAAGL